ncbi:MAG: spore cortex biosynthesis protein YabQ [Clostridia bacterium]
MEEIINNQAYLFVIYFICGIIIGIFFDLFRILRKSFKTSDFVTYVEDIIFGILTGIFLIFMLFVFNNGQLRFYIFLAITLGLTIYMLTISKYFIKINVKIIVTIKKILIKIISIIFYPIKKLFDILRKYVLKIILKPFKILTINVKNIHISKNKTKNMLKNNIKKHFKKKNKKDDKN